MDSEIAFILILTVGKDEAEESFSDAGAVEGDGEDAVARMDVSLIGLMFVCDYKYNLYRSFLQIGLVTVTLRKLLTLSGILRLQK